MFHLETRQTLPADRTSVFDFFSNPANLNRITPDRLHFQILTDLPVICSHRQKNLAEIFDGPNETAKKRS